MLKSEFCFLAVVAMVAAAAMGVRGPSSSSDPKFLRASGNNIVCSGNNKTIALNGVNLGGAWVFEKWMSPLDPTVADDRTMKAILTTRFGAEKTATLLNKYHDAWVSDADLARIAKQGLNVIRMPVYDLNFLDEAGAYLSSTPFADLDKLIERAWAHGLYTIIDMHGVPASQNGEEHSGRKGSAGYWGNATARALACTLWEAIAQHYAGNPAVAGYDLLNEPTGASGHSQWDAYDELYRRVRKADPEHIIFIEAVWAWDDLPKPAVYGWTNVVYEFHHYEWGKDKQAQIAAVDNAVRNFADHKAWGVPCFIGEFNFFQYEAAWKYGIEAFNENGISWTTWSYKTSHGSNNDSWGLYDLKAGQDPPPVPALETDSFDTIAEKWGLWTTENAFELNTMLARTLIPAASSASC